MPLVAYNQLPSFQRLEHEGYDILSTERADAQDIRELHIGLLNMMPDAALEATERQFCRLIGASNLIVQFHIHPFTLDAQVRDETAQQHIDQYYTSFAQIKKEGLDALIITGANPVQPHLEDEPFWQGLIEVVQWAEQNVTSTLCSCLATHAIIQHHWNIKRQPLENKCWGVFDHTVTTAQHPLVFNINTRFDVPHSRNNEVSRTQLEAKGLHVLVDSEVAGPHLIVSPDQFRLIFLQGHPEYDIVSLLKEYKREVSRWHQGTRMQYPPMPDNYFGLQARTILNEYRYHVERAKIQNKAQPPFPDHLLHPLLHNTWRDTGKSIISNWLGKVYQLTHSQRHLPFMEGVDRDDPLGLNR